MQVFIIINNAGIMINVDVNAKNSRIWNPSNYQCECDKSCGVEEYSDYTSCKCRKILTYKLVEECSEDINGNENIYNATLNDYEKVYNS